RDDTGTRELMELHLYEFSAVTFGANEETPFLGMKSAEDVNRLFERMGKLQRALRKDLSEETFEMLEIEIQQYQQAIINLQKSLANSSPGDTSNPTYEIRKMLDEQTHAMQTFLKG
ncbi:MAG TPA: hypothetical protein VII11_04030, partial [Bacteroidota bacterium]